ncbi:MAG: hypothetical protein IIA14_14690, partial [SAR324 cluster bacterium]|nr:hypothetical protein [SAR324 cluster bacterium]
AGDAGRGFAVVAEEVRNLAQRSAEAAKTTSNLIEDSQRKADAGVNIASDVDTVLREVNAAVEKVENLLKEISAASKEQAQGVSQINSAVAQMGQVTQGTAESAEQTATAGQQLSSQAINLNAMMSELARIVGGALQSNGHKGKPSLPEPLAGPSGAVNGSDSKSKELLIPSETVEETPAKPRSLRDRIVQDQTEGVSVPPNFRKLDSRDFREIAE